MQRFLRYLPIPIIVVFLLTTMGQLTLAAGPTRPFEGERHLTAADEALALRDMPKAERDELEPLFADDRNLIVGYARRIVDFVPQADGTYEVRQRGILSRLGEPLDIPSVEQAKVVDTYVPGKSLYQSLTVSRACSSCLRWNIRHFYNWYGTTGNTNNGNPDRIAVAWSDGLDNVDYSYYMTGKYTNGVNIVAIDQWVNAAAGVGWSFREWYHSSLGYYADWGRGYAAMSEPHLRGDTTTVVAGYAHTGWGNTGGSIGIGPASITFYGVDDFEWQFSLTVST